MIQLHYIKLRNVMNHNHEFFPDIDMIDIDELCNKQHADKLEILIESQWPYMPTVLCAHLRRLLDIINLSENYPICKQSNSSLSQAKMTPSKPMKN